MSIKKLNYNISTQGRNVQQKKKENVLYVPAWNDLLMEMEMMVRMMRMIPITVTDILSTYYVLGTVLGTLSWQLIYLRYVVKRTKQDVGFMNDLLPFGRK